jgi:hypothetical protein
MEQITYRQATLADVSTMASLRERSGWLGGASEATMRLYLAGEHHPQYALAPRVTFLVSPLGPRCAAWLPSLPDLCRI